MQGDEGAEIWICQGPPMCSLEGEAAQEAIRAGCTWCDILIVGPDGTESYQRKCGNA